MLHKLAGCPVRASTCHRRTFKGQTSEMRDWGGRPHATAGGWAQEAGRHDPARGPRGRPEEGQPACSQRSGLALGPAHRSPGPHPAPPSGGPALPSSGSGSRSGSGSGSIEPSAGAPGLPVLRRVIWPLGPEPWPAAEHSCFAGGPCVSGEAGRTGGPSPGQAWGHALARRPRSLARGAELGAALRPGESSSPLPWPPSESGGPARRPLGCRGQLLGLRPAAGQSSRCVLDPPGCRAPLPADTAKARGRSFSPSPFSGLPRHTGSSPQVGEPASLRRTRSRLSGPERARTAVGTGGGGLGSPCTAAESVGPPPADPAAPSPSGASSGRGQVLSFRMSRATRSARL